MAGILKENPAAVTDTGTQIPSELGRVIHRCLAKNPAERFHSAPRSGNRTEGTAWRRCGRGGERPARGKGGDAACGPSRIPGDCRWTRDSARTLLRRSHTQRIGTLAVLPFANMSGNPDSDYLSDGITESVMDSLSELPNLR